ncbi:hypothetical protein CSB07_01195 [Candidatus Gracilibacteria bacterium]|nr:MAG: hypothetical protein CSB07_01195 [Candidatus Gracilibacteria bacterium]PIE85598.1 MAG: hypothetical protein CSA08_01150 [Candidatus Gracilibacteria bacterium]
MKKDKLNIKLREFARNLSPRDSEKKLVKDIYDALKNVLGESNCIQIGSYPRYTSITPMHDLDVLYILGDWNPNSHDPRLVLSDLYNRLISDFDNPTNYEIKISYQTHSITISFQENGEEKFGLDVVPAYKFGKNEFSLDKYKVPEIVNLSHKSRTNKYKRIIKLHEEMGWINSDPRGYIEIAKNLNQSNEDFRKSVKLVKKWKSNLCNIDKELKLKSFHLEQVITKYYLEDNSLTIFDTIFKFFTKLPEIIGEPNQIQDRANSDKFIDDYLEKLTGEQKEKIIQARDCFLINLENITYDKNIGILFDVCFYERSGTDEKFLFDQGIPVFLDSEYKFKIYGEAQQGNGFLKKILDKVGFIENKRKIIFGIIGNRPNVDIFKWKVRNDDNCGEPRGEITDNQTLNYPESTAYGGNHYVECYAILNNTCVAKAKQNVCLNK